MHTIVSVKRDLPTVRIIVDGATVDGRIVGRLLKFPFVCVGGHNGPRFEFAWTTIVDALNADRPLRA